MDAEAPGAAQDGPRYPEFAELLDIVFPLAEEELRNSGSFAPFGGGITSDTQVELLKPDDDHWQTGDPPLVELLTERLRARAARGELRVSVLCFNARVEVPEDGIDTDAICAQLENLAGEAIDVFYPYETDAAGALTFGESFAWEGERRIFADPESGHPAEAGPPPEELDD
jgi:hypothetical protein